MRSAVAALASALCLAAPLVLAGPPGAAGWTEIGEEEGIRLWRREVPGSAFVAFRGEGEVGASLKKVLAVLHDQERKQEWMHRCAENRLVEARKIGEVTIYNRTGSNVPLVADRDVVVSTRLSWSVEDRRVHIEAHSVDHPGAPPRDGVVRMPKLSLSWDLVALSADRTRVTYEVQADPGGLLPAWVVNMASKMIPYHTISGLRRQTKAPYPKAEAVIEMAFDWDAVRWPSTN